MKTSNTTVGILNYVQDISTTLSKDIVVPAYSRSNIEGYNWGSIWVPFFRLKNEIIYLKNLLIVAIDDLSSCKPSSLDASIRHCIREVIKNDLPCEYMNHFKQWYLQILAQIQSEQMKLPEAIELFKVALGELKASLDALENKYPHF